MKLLEKLQYLNQCCSDISLKGIRIAPLWMEGYLKLLLTGSCSTFEFPSRVNFSGPSLYCIARSVGKWSRLSIGLAAATRLTRSDFRLNFLLLKGQRFVVYIPFQLNKLSETQFVYVMFIKVAELAWFIFYKGGWISSEASTLSIHVCWCNV